MYKIQEPKEGINNNTSTPQARVPIILLLMTITQRKNGFQGYFSGIKLMQNFVKI